MFWMTSIGITYNFQSFFFLIYFQLCFTDADMLQEESLLRVAEECGLDRAKAEEYLRTKENLESTYYKALSWSEKGVTGILFLKPL